MPLELHHQGNPTLLFCSQFLTCSVLHWLHKTMKVFLLASLLAHFLALRCPAKTGVHWVRSLVSVCIPSQGTSSPVQRRVCCSREWSTLGSVCLWLARSCWSLFRKLTSCTSTRTRPRSSASSTFACAKSRLVLPSTECFLLVPSSHCWLALETPVQTHSLNLSQIPQSSPLSNYAALVSSQDSTRTYSQQSRTLALTRLLTECHYQTLWSVTFS